MHMPINCVHTLLDLIKNLIQVTHFRKNSLCLNVLIDSNCKLSRCMCVRGKWGGGGGGGGRSSIFRRSVSG